jgi:glyoxylase-like metal-dependent hydrolase (beta-lactamase superfamily II)
MKITDILGSIRTCTVPTPFPVGPINCYLILGDEPTLIDTGPDDAATLESMRAQLASHGLAFKDIRRIVVTHAHVDHFGLAGRIVAESGARVLSHERNRWWLTDFENERSRRNDFYRDLFVTSGAPREMAESAVQGMRRVIGYASSVPAELFVPLGEGDTLALGGDTWQIIHAPGHASGLVCLFEPLARVLISSDHLLLDITSNPTLEPPGHGETERPRALIDYLASMRRSALLDPRVALPAHGEPIYDVRALVDGRLAFHRSRLDHIEQQLRCCVDTAFELVNVLFPGLESFGIFLGLSEVIGHLDILEAEGRVRREMTDGLVRYIPLPE